MTTWFRDDIFFPMSHVLSRRVKDGRWMGLRADLRIYAGATMVTFLLSGLWHRASWNYVLWGVYHGVLLVVARPSSTLMSPPRAVRLYLRVLQVPARFLFTNIGWLIFREPGRRQPSAV